MVERIIPAIILCADSLNDFKNKEIFLLLTIIGAAEGTLMKLIIPETDLLLIAVSFLPGVLLLAVSAVSRGQTGAGDALVFFMTGAWTGPGVWRILLSAFFGAAFFGGILWLMKRKNEEFPFVPFILAGFLLDTLVFIFTG